MADDNDDDDDDDDDYDDGDEEDDADVHVTDNVERSEKGRKRERD